MPLSPSSSTSTSTSSSLARLAAGVEAGAAASAASGGTDGGNRHNDKNAPVNSGTATAAATDTSSKSRTRKRSLATKDNKNNRKDEADDKKDKKDEEEEEEEEEEGKDGKVRRLSRKPSKSSSTSSTLSTSEVDYRPSVFDLLETGQRLEVRWDVSFEGSDSVEESRWWPCSVLSLGSTATTGASTNTDDEWHSLSMNEAQSALQLESVQQVMEALKLSTSPSQQPPKSLRLPICRVKYDAYPEGGFPETSSESVCFLTNHLLLILQSTGDGYSAYFRRQGEDWELEDDDDDDEEYEEQEEDEREPKAGEGSDTTSSLLLPAREETLRALLNQVLQQALENTGVHQRLQRECTASQRFAFGDRVAQTKESLLQKLMKHLESSSRGGQTTITPAIIQECMQELGREQNAAF